VSQNERVPEIFRQNASLEMVGHSERQKAHPGCVSCKTGEAETDAILYPLLECIAYGAYQDFPGREHDPQSARLLIQFPLESLGHRFCEDPVWAEELLSPHEDQHYVHASWCFCQVHRRAAVIRGTPFPQTPRSEETGKSVERKQKPADFKPCFMAMLLLELVQGDLLSTC